MAIEESYVASTIDTFREMPADLAAYRRTDGACDPTRPQAPVDTVAGFWGVGRMIDWSDPAAGAWIHDRRRFPNLVANGITAHWTDLGEPESFDETACYEGIGTDGPGRRTEHRHVHNLYNFLWNRSIWDGYFARRGQADGLGTVNPRPFVLTRSGAAGAQRFGAAMWSGDIASDLRALATHLNAQMHMSLSGIDYYGADIGGFRREALPGNDHTGAYRGYEAELFTQWLANGAWFDVPVRPHTDNEFVRVDPPYATAPHLVGERASNLANLRQRYELIPYYYSLAYRAHLLGEPVVPPLVVHHQADPNVRRIGHEKLIGRDLLVAAVAGHGQYERDVYLPAGRWVNYHTGEWIESRGEVLRDVPTYRDGVFRLPAFARAGAILPQMSMAAQTTDAFGNRTPGTPAQDELIVRVYADEAPSEFTHYEDDGRTLDYTAEGRPVYRHTTTRIAQRQRPDGTATVTIDPAADVNGRFGGAPAQRRLVVRLVVRDAEAAAVELDGTPLSQHATRAAFDGAESGWFNAGPNLILAKSDALQVRSTAKTFAFRLVPVAPTTSVSFVCDRGHTQPGTSVYVVGDLPALGGWDPARAVRLSPSIYYTYVIDRKAAETGVGPLDPVWTGTIAGLPPASTLRWKCIRRRDDGGGTVDWEPGSDNVHTTGASGYAGRTYGSF